MVTRLIAFLAVACAACSGPGVIPWADGEGDGDNAPVPSSTPEVIVEPTPVPFDATALTSISTWAKITDPAIAVRVLELSNPVTISALYEDPRSALTKDSNDYGCPIRSTVGAITYYQGPCDTGAPTPTHYGGALEVTAERVVYKNFVRVTETTCGAGEAAQIETTWNGQHDTPADTAPTTLILAKRTRGQDGTSCEPYEQIFAFRLTGTSSFPAPGENEIALDYEGTMAAQGAGVGPADSPVAWNVTIDDFVYLTDDRRLDGGYCMEPESGLLAVWTGETAGEHRATLRPDLDVECTLAPSTPFEIDGVLVGSVEANVAGCSIGGRVGPESRLVAFLAIALGLLTRRRYAPARG